MKKAAAIVFIGVHVQEFAESLWWRVVSDGDIDNELLSKR